MAENSPKSKKNSSFFLLSVIVLAIVAGVIIFFFRKNQSAPEMGADGNGRVESNLENEEGVGKQIFKMEADGDNRDELQFAEIMNNANRDGSYICQLSNEDGAFTYYFNNDEILVEVEYSDEYETGHFFTLIKKDYTYNWQADEKTGTKMLSFTEDDMDDMEDEAEEYLDDMEEYDYVDEVESVNYDYDYDPMSFECRNWKADAGKFTPPSDVVFQDLSQMQEEMINMFAE